MQHFNDLLATFETYLQQQTMPNTPANLYDPCKQILQLGGKRVRPVSLLMSHELFLPINDQALHAATAIEMFHNFTLIHDDIMDNAPLRRGLPTVHTQWNLPVAILSGDVMNIFAYQHLNKVDKEALPLVLEVFNKTAIEVCEGQQIDMDFETQETVSISDYINMITLKTSVLLAASLEIGAILGGASVGTAKQLYEFGKNVGISFQLKDDYLDAFGTEEKIGKQIGGDILANKKTFLLLKAFEKANSQQKEELTNLIQTNEPNKVENVLALFEELDIKKEAQKIKQLYCDKAFAILESIPVMQLRKQSLFELANMLLNREK